MTVPKLMSLCWSSQLSRTRVASGFEETVGLFLRNREVSLDDIIPFSSDGVSFPKQKQFSDMAATEQAEIDHALQVPRLASFLR